MVWGIAARARPDKVLVSMQLGKKQAGIFHFSWHLVREIRFLLLVLSFKSMDNRSCPFVGSIDSPVLDFKILDLKTRGSFIACVIDLHACRLNDCTFNQLNLVVVGITSRCCTYFTIIEIQQATSV